MRPITNQAILIFLIAITILLLYLLAPILTPFLLGALIAYLADPLVKRLEKWFKMPHLLSVTIVFLFLLTLFLCLILLLIPLIQVQLTAFLAELPKIVAWVENTVRPQFRSIVDIGTVKNTISAGVSKSGWVFSTVIQSGFTLIELGINLILTPIVTFYLLRDWDRILAALTKLIPPAYKKTVIHLAKECDQILGAFLRGQLLVMLALAIMYGVGLTIVGLQVGLIIGLLGGLLSIVPYLGSTFVLLTATLTALVQFGTWHALLGVLIVFIIGQIIESYILTPYLIGERIGLHPVAVIFAIMAGGALFGFFGVLLALPVAAVSKVLLRFALRRFHLLHTN